ncbi:acetate/propionate family kinase [Nocardioides sp. BP30]|uniref:acetate/propionate family kinase n=1 Tax=Nocardioides sp. BP30 TaxID=3036374 RepID=UPI0024685B21|nr:acetate/propionate family kinase [Nocardioides sp. BP30]WGL50565.1 acetate/propionate family kinase [Nocardioides sp. BP30]
MRVLVLNPGSTSLKAALVEDGETVRTASVGAGEALEEVARVAAGWMPLDAAAVRFVHGGPDHLQPVPLDERVLAELVEVTPLAPLHNPTALAAARALLDAHPDLPLVACFDTTFHADLPAAAATYALPREWNRRWRLRRYGFHGLSHEYAAGRAAELLGRPAADLRLVICHLGGGASLCAVAGGRSVDTTMGYTPLEGLAMQVRSGSVDPGLLLWLQQVGGIGVEELGETLERHSGMAGLSGTSGDLREVVAGAARGEADSRLAFDVYVHRLAREIGGMVASAGGLDALVLTGGVGEHQAEVRAGVGERLGWLGIAVDPERNAAQPGEDRDIAAPGGVPVLVVAAREELVAAEHAVRVLEREA